MSRRRLAFWAGLCLFWLSDKTSASFLDSAGAVLMDWTEGHSLATARLQWRPNENRSWQWYELRHQTTTGSRVVGVTTPINKATGERHEGDGYVDESLVPESVKQQATALRKKLAMARVDEARRTRDGRPPSRWLRSLTADEIRIWLRTIDVPEVGVSGMTFWTHLTRDHAFLADRIRGLNEIEQAKLHAAAHFGY